MEKALAMVKKELGPDAIILSSRKASLGFGGSCVRGERGSRPTTSARPRSFRQIGV